MLIRFSAGVIYGEFWVTSDMLLPVKSLVTNFYCRDESVRTLNLELKIQSSAWGVLPRLAMLVHRIRLG